MKCVDKYCIEGVVRTKEHWEVRAGYQKGTNQPLYIVVYSLRHIERTPPLGKKLYNDMNIVESVPSPLILKRLNYVKTENNMYHVYEKLAPGSLRELLGAREGLGEAEAVRLLREMARCLGTLHAHNAIHRNLRTSLFLLKEGELRLTGLLNAVALDDGAAPDELIDGNAAYQAPEARGRPADKKADMYALGAIFFELLFGAAPARHPAQSFPYSPRSLGEKTEFLLHGLLAPVPSMRFDCTEVLQFIEASGPASALRGPPPPRAPDPVQTSLAAFTARVDFLGRFGDELGERWGHVETGVYLLYVVLKRVVQVTTAYKAHLDFQHGSGHPAAQREADFERLELFVRQSEREAMSCLISMQNCLQKHLVGTVAAALAKDLEELAELDCGALRELVIEPFLEQVKSSPAAQAVVKETQKFYRLFEDNLWINFDASSTELLV